MSKQDRDRRAVEQVTERFYRQAQKEGRPVSREAIRADVVKHQVRRDIQGKNN
jgi:hypothetical protein